MEQRGRKSVAGLSVAPVERDQRLAPVPGLTAEQKSVWVSVVNAREAGWFGEEHAGMLAQYCRHKVQADAIASQIDEFEPEWLETQEGLKRWDTLHRMADRETRNMLACLRSMRITHQSLVRADKAVHPKRSKRPWES